ncbi:hypothetical protein GEMRC1_011018 [Eukaryota sp. GEM-RC1]
MSTHILLLPTLLSLCFCSRILLSNPIPLEFNLNGVSSTRSLHLVIGNIDDNEHPDAILFYSSGQTSPNWSTSTHWRYRVFYDINLGPREWQGRHGFFPLITTGYSEFFRQSTTTSTSWPTTNERTSYSCGYYCTAYRYVNFHRLTTFASTDLDNNGQLDVVQVSAVHCCEHPRWVYSCEPGCAWRYRDHLSVRIRIYRNFRKDGSFTSFLAPSRTHFSLNVGPDVSVSHANRKGPEALNAYVEVNECGGSHPHRVNIMLGHWRHRVCMSDGGELLDSSVSSNRISSDRNVPDLSSSTMMNVNGEKWGLVVRREEGNKSWRLSHSTSQTSWSGTIEEIPADSAVAAGAFDFDRDGVDDLILVDCDSASDCRMRHGIVQHSSLDSGFNHEYQNSFLM